MGCQFACCEIIQRGETRRSLVNEPTMFDTGKIRVGLIRLTVVRHNYDFIIGIAGFCVTGSQRSARGDPNDRAAK